MNPFLEEDISRVAHSPILAQLPAGSSIFITGATGLIGSLLVRSLLASDQKIRVIAPVRNLEKAKTVFGGLQHCGRLVLFLGENSQKLDTKEKIDYIIHCASPTGSRYFVEHPAKTIASILDGTRNIMELARQKQVKKVIFLSSLEVYGVPDPSKPTVGETDYGYLDPMQVRSSYSEGKRMAECICVSYWKEYGVPVTVARLSQTFGPGVSYDDGRVFAEFARCALEGREIILRTQGNTLRSYCYTADAVIAILTLLIAGKPGEAYNVTNMDTAITIRDMAQLVCSLVPEKKIRVRFELPANLDAFGYNPETVIRLDSRKLQHLGWQPTTALPEMFLRLMGSMISTPGEKQ